MASGSVVVAASQVPFERGGAEWHAEALTRQLAAAGWRACLVQLPFQWLPREQVLRCALAWRLLDFSAAGPRPVDRLIATRFPSYVARHPRKVTWLFHQFRQAYDLHDAGIDGFPDTPEGRELRRELVALDTRALGECRRIYTTSRTNANRLLKYNGLSAEVLRLPLLDPASYRCEGFDPYVLSVGRLETMKRVELLVRAAAELPALRVVVAGEGTQEPALRRLVLELGLAGRVDFRGRVPDAELKSLYARCRAVFFAPWDEDYGLVTLEAFQSGKPVVTTSDAGGVLEFVSHAETGLVSAAEPAAIAANLTRLLEDPAEAARLGKAGHAAVSGIGWDEVIAKLMAD